MTTPLNAERLTEIEARANRLCRCDDEACIAEMNQVGDQDVPALIAEIKRLNTEIEQLQVELGYALAPDDDEPLTTRDVDPGAVYATEDDDYFEERSEAHSSEAPF